MGKLFSLVLLFITVFILQQSNFIEMKKVPDPRLGVAKEEYRMNWNNVVDYVEKIPEKIDGLFHPKSKSRKHRY